VTVCIPPNKAHPLARAWPAWLGEEPADEAQLKALPAPYPSDEMICWPVSARVGSVKNNDPSLGEPINLP
jgi:putative SOS response-associated peptidase YedK